MHGLISLNLKRDHALPIGLSPQKYGSKIISFLGVLAFILSSTASRLENIDPKTEENTCCGK
jgi:hypothetical protein